MDTKGGRSPILGAHPMKTAKSIPISTKSFRPVGPIQLANTSQVHE